MTMMMMMMMLAMMMTRKTTTKMKRSLVFGIDDLPKEKEVDYGASDEEDSDPTTLRRRRGLSSKEWTRRRHLHPRGRFPSLTPSRRKRTMSLSPRPTMKIRRMKTDSV